MSDNRKVFSDAPLIVLVDTLFSFFVGLTIFAAMGNLAKTRGVDINEVLKSGTVLVFHKHCH